MDVATIEGHVWAKMPPEVAMALQAQGGPLAQPQGAHAAIVLTYLCVVLMRGLGTTYVYTYLHMHMYVYNRYTHTHKNLYVYT